MSQNPQKNLQQNPQPQQIQPSSDAQVAQQQIPIPSQQQIIHQYDNIMQQNIQYNNNQQFMNDQENPVIMYTNRIKQLQQKQQILKYSISQHQQSVKKLYMKLYQKKKLLLNVITKQYNNNNMLLDIGLYEQFEQMKKIIQNQTYKINKLQIQIQNQGLASASNSIDSLMLKQKKQNLIAEIEKGRKFASSQYVRDYLQRTYIHKVSYQDVKYQYQMKIKLKQYLQAQKILYDKKKQQLKKAIQQEGNTKKQLQEQKARLELIVSSKNSNGK